ncbi:dehydrogenase [Histoplasma capsulatum var. duboisii H88]|uniref:Dehydrogenase n=1 Tax=Ajellomyces capsulatus (strain H88) TaxID=544711 RepID=F0U532_AJEC8|nr:dehydrogenase [Histoplasma capsulatum var. duboisii H88]QSS52347.1 oxidoreductase [Histoplasma capsulatum var. duboisii H88]
MGDAPLPQEHLLVILPFDEPVALINDIRESFPHIRVSYFRQQRETQVHGAVPKDLLNSATILCMLHYAPILEDIPNVKFVHIVSAGMDRYLSHPLLTDTEIDLTTTSGIHGPPTAEWVVMNWLVSSKMYDQTSEWQRKHIWTHNQSLMDKMEDHVGKRVGILGYGSIGRQVARVSVAMGMQVLAFTFFPRTTPESRRDNGYIVPNTGDPDGSLPVSWHSGSDKAALHAFLSQNLDYLLVSVPLTPSTEYLIGAEEIALLSKSCTRTTRRPFLTNISRGMVIDQDALLESLKSGELGGAAIDVTEPEPLPADHLLWDAPNLHISPHISSLGIEYLQRALDVLKVNLDRLEKGEQLVNLYRRKMGY